MTQTIEGKAFPFGWVECVSGLKMSIRAGMGVYSDPRVDNADYTEVEVGYPSEVVEEIKPYQEGFGDPTDTVYPYVPVSVVLAVIKNHGGIKGGKTA